MDPMIFPVSPFGGDDMKHNQHHTLFTKDVPPQTIEVFPASKQYTFYLTDFGEDSRGLHDAFNHLRQADEMDELTIRIASNGGYVNEGEMFYNLITEKFKDRCTTVLDPHGYSMGALTFCMGDYRVAYENSSIMFHNYSGGAYGKGNELMTQAKYQDEQLKTFFESVIVGLDSDEIERMYKGEDFWFGASDMCKRGISTHILVGEHHVEAKDYLKLMTKMRKEAKAAGIKKVIKTLAEANKIHGIDVMSAWVETKLQEQEG